MRLGGMVTPQAQTPAAWVAAVQAKGYRAAYAPVGLHADMPTVAAYRQAAIDADIVIAEVGAWSNPLADDPAERAAALTKCVDALRLADALGARCCVNIAGSRGARWDGPHAANLMDETFEMIVRTVLDIIDRAEPQHAKYTLETMPWIFPNSTASYLRLRETINSPHFGVHFDPVNMINSPDRYFTNAAVIREFVAALGPQILAVHVKDIKLRDTLTVHLDEVAPGEGALAINVLVRELAALDDDIPLMLEHLPNAAAYDAAASHVRRVAAAEGVQL